MRDPIRRKRLLKIIEKVWSKHNDLRLMQLLVNAIERVNKDYYYVEDDILETVLKEYK